MATVSIVSKLIPHYRVPFFLALASNLKARGVDLKVYHGDASPKSAGKSVGSGILPPEIDCWVKLSYLPKNFIYHHLPPGVSDSDLIIMSQANSILTNYEILVKRRLGKKFKTAFWGHGQNFQSKESSDFIARWLRNFILMKVDSWFAYNELSARIVRNLGFPEDRIFAVNNAIDTNDLVLCREGLTENDLEAARIELGIQSSNIAVYTGGLHKIKRVDFLIESAILIRDRIPDFELIVIGSGPDQPIVERAAERFSWIHVLGAKDGREKAPYWALSKVLLMPGGVGLVVLDSFALGVPMVTTDTDLHGPEIDYLKSGENGLLIPCGESAEIYAEGVVDLLANPLLVNRLRCGALASAMHYTIENMAENFASGIMRALNQKPD
jgi:glycosyltransferase involved in cell wall biosynthesis